jgi:hypothetical protein
MAKIIDTDVTEQEDNSTEFASLTEEQPTQEAPAEPAEEATEAVVESEVAEEEAEDLPEKYKGKSAAELARMHQNLESLMGKQSSEVGELRKAVDQLVQSNMQTQATATSAPEPEIDDSEFFTNPRGAVERLIAENPTLQSAQQVAAEMSKQQALAALQNAHPDMNKIVTDDAFQKWVGGSKIRTEMFRKADQQYDYEQANELFNLWKERATTVTQAKAVEKLAQKQQLKRASTGSARANPEGKAVKKVYRRRDIIDLMNRDPKRYQAMQSEIMLAYQEGRVK